MTMSPSRGSSAELSMRLAIVMISLLLSSSVYAESFLIQNSKATGSILVPSEASPEVKLASEELANHLEKMTGAKLPIEVDSGAELRAGSVRLVISPDAAKASVRDGSSQG